jgi:hypothetical protein
VSPTHGGDLQFAFDRIFGSDRYSSEEAIISLCQWFKDGFVDGWTEVITGEQGYFDTNDEFANNLSRMTDSLSTVTDTFTLPIGRLFTYLFKLHDRSLDIQSWTARE